MKNFLIKYSTGKTVLVLFILANSIYAIMVAVTIPKTAQFADGMKILDMMPGGYDFDYVYSLFNTLGEAGRNTYRNTQIPFDMVYPALFALSFSLLLAFFLKKLNRQNTWLIYVCILPFIGGIADYAENIGIIFMLNRHPAFTVQTVELVCTFSIIKSSATTIYFLILLVVILWFAINWLQRLKAKV